MQAEQNQHDRHRRIARGARGVGFALVGADIVDWAVTSETFREIIARDKVIVKLMAPRGAGRPRHLTGEHSISKLTRLTSYFIYVSEK
uniref:Uncharacterized protein n=1 Tax=Candidatus Kentrum sp. LPFa TaxID=2126335 RepID=A0A450WPZ6_9GAMM|nr:MAG: hypothetical protein BECKLPF1236B_GA0070989_11603 [Candidatus Kentron sp. LPFa]